MNNSTKKQPLTKRTSIRITRASCIILISTIILTGCQSTENTAFSDITNASVLMRDGVNEIATNVYSRADELNSDNTFPPEMLRKITNKKCDEQALRNEVSQLKKETCRFEFSSVPKYISRQNKMVALQQLAQGVVSYVQTLESLAQGDYSDKDAASLDALTSSINANLFSATLLINEDASVNSAESVGIFSTLASEGFKAYLNNKKKSELIKAINNNQSTIDSYTSTMKKAIIAIGQTADTNYTVNEKIIQDKASSDLNDVQLTKLSEQVKTLNRDYFATMSKLAALYSAVSVFPDAHADAAKALDNSSTVSLGSVTAFLTYSIDLKSKSDAAITANKTILLNQDHLNLESKAAELELEAKIAMREYAIENALATEARIAATSDPTDSSKESLALELETSAAELKMEADELNNQATSLREAATAVKKTTQAITGS